MGVLWGRGVPSRGKQEGEETELVVANIEEDQEQSNERSSKVVRWSDVRLHDGYWQIGVGGALCLPEPFILIPSIITEVCSLYFSLFL